MIATRSDPHARPAGTTPQPTPNQYFSAKSHGLDILEISPSRKPLILDTLFPRSVEGGRGGSSTPTPASIPPEDQIHPRHKTNDSYRAGETLPRRAIITGGNGYAGSELVGQLIVQRWEVHAIAHNNIDRLCQFLPPSRIYPIGEDFPAIDALVRAVQPDAIFHLAAIHSEPPAFDEMMGMINCSLMLGVALLHGAQACHNRPVFVHAGTYWQFNDGVYQPNTFYASAKQALHDLLTYYRRAHTIPSVTLVLYDIFGPGDTRPKLWSKIRDAPPGAVFPVSEGRQFIELVHVSDIARAFLQAAALLLEGVPLEPFHAVRSGVRITLRQLLEELQQRAHLDLTFDWGAIPYWPGQIFEPWHGPLLPGWQPTIDPISGIQAVILERNPATQSSTELKCS